MLLCAICACGRLGFDATDAGPSTGELPDARVCTSFQHDEDGDGIDDSCDVCPHLADPVQDDGDVDGVGDACDPEPTLPRQAIMFFEPFINRDQWRSTVPSTTDGESLQIACPPARARSPSTPSPDR